MSKVVYIHYLLYYRFCNDQILQSSGIFVTIILLKIFFKKSQLLSSNHIPQCSCSLMSLGDLHTLGSQLPMSSPLTSLI